MMLKILFAEDEELLRKLVKELLEDEGYEVLCAADGREALDLFWEHATELSLVLLDIMMPYYDGIYVLKEIRERSDIPVLMLTALGDTANELKCLRLGANDFISKPFHNEILVERIKNLFSLTKANVADTIHLELLEFNPLTHKVYVEGEEIVLNNKEFRLLEYFLLNRNLVLSRERILDHIWGYDYEGDIRTIDTHVKMLRASLKAAGQYIKTVRGTGYVFEETNQDVSAIQT